MAELKASQTINVKPQSVTPSVRDALYDDISLIMKTVFTFNKGFQFDSD